MHTKGWISILVLFTLLASCNLPVGQATANPPANQPVSANEDEIGTAVALTSAAQLTQAAGSVVVAETTFTPSLTPTLTFTPTFTFTPTLPFTPTQCVPLVTATANVNIRSGPGTVYDIVGLLPQGQTANVVGRNDAYTWWYIDVAGGHGWVAGSVVTSACIPQVVQVVAAPPTPVFTPTEVVSSSSSGSGAAGRDLVPVGMTVNPNPTKKGEQIQVTVGLKNQGDKRAGNFTVQWWSSHALVGCEWRVNGLEPGMSVNLSCSYTYNSCSTYDNIFVIDSASEVPEVDEGNNSMSRKLKVACS